MLLLEMIGAAVITAVFLGTADRHSGRSTAPVAVGLSFAVLLQLGLSVGNLPFNPARAVASAVFVAAGEADSKPAAKDTQAEASEAQEFFDGKRG